MTHFAAVVLVPKDVLVLEERVAVLLEPYKEEEEWGEDGTRWDWWQIGGRFTGTLSGYEWWKDEENYSKCKFCGGTGFTTQAVADIYPAYADGVGEACIQCNKELDGEAPPFPGKSANFQLMPHAGDVMPVSSIDFDRMRFVPSALVTPDGEWHEQVRYGMFAAELPNEEGEEPKNQGQWAREFSGILAEHRDCLAVVVDCHV